MRAEYLIRRIHCLSALHYHAANIGTFFIPANFLLLIHKVHLIHFLSFDLVNDVNVWLHGLVVTVSSPFHDDARRDALGEGMDNECPSSGMRSDQLPLLCDLVNSFVSFVGGRSDLLVDFGQLA